MIANKVPLQDYDESPFLPSNLLNLFFRPRRFYSSPVAFQSAPYTYFFAWLFGIADVMNRVDENIARAEIGVPRASWDTLQSLVAQGWLRYWLLVLVFGAIGAPILWWIGGWFYKLRLRFSDAEQPDGQLARSIYVSAAFVRSAPVLITTLIYTLAYPSYLDAYFSDEMLSVVLLLFPFWSAIVSYVGVQQCFEVTTWKARLWFIILPILFNILGLGLLAALIANL